MRINVDGVAVELAAGMTVRHALLARYGTITPATIVNDRWGNQLGLDGALEDGGAIRTTLLVDKQRP